MYAGLKGGKMSSTGRGKEGRAREPQPVVPPTHAPVKCIKIFALGCI